MSERVSFAAYRVKGWLAWQCVRWFPLPMFWKPTNPIYRLSARLWGIAYTADAFPTFVDWQQYVRRPRHD